MVTIVVGGMCYAYLLIKIVLCVDIFNVGLYALFSVLPGKVGIDLLVFILIIYQVVIATIRQPI